MIAQVTAAALASENKSLAHPASVDSLPTSANQEDHVSMATFAGRRLKDMAENTRGILAVELLAAAQGLDFRAPLVSSTLIEGAKAELRERVAFYDKDRYCAPDMDKADQADVAAGFQAAVIDVLSKKLINAAQSRKCKRIGIAGGVSANQTFVAALENRSGKHGIKVFSPPLSLCGDNAAMIAARGFTMIQNNDLCTKDHDVFSRTRI